MMGREERERLTDGCRPKCDRDGLGVLFCEPIGTRHGLTADCFLDSISTRCGCSALQTKSTAIRAASLGPPLRSPPSVARLPLSPCS